MALVQNIAYGIPSDELNEYGVISFKLTQGLCHENIAQVFHGRYYNETIGSYQYVKTESFDGELLSDKLKREGELPLDEAVRIYLGLPPL